MYKQLLSEQRYTIFILLQQGMKQKDIAKAIEVSASTISRELKRNWVNRDITITRLPSSMPIIVSIVDQVTEPNHR